MKKTIILFLVAIISFVNVFCFSGCGCEHEWTKISDTATCEDIGEAIYLCDLCGETKTETINATNHNWKIEIHNATCEDEGYSEYICKKCGKTEIKDKVEPTGHNWQTINYSAECAIKKQCVNCGKVEIEQVFGVNHTYNSDGHCKYCGQFKYNISVNEQLPVTLSYKGYYSTYSKCCVSDVHFIIAQNYNKTYYIYALFYGKKTYDEDGQYGSNTIKFKYILKNSTGEIVASGYVSDWNLVVGQKFGEDGYISKSLCKLSSLSTNETYTLYLIDYTI